jgi:hypothetical protein
VWFFLLVFRLTFQFVSALVYRQLVVSCLLLMVDFVAWQR